MIIKPIFKTILAVIAIPVLGFVLLNITFIFYALIQSLLDYIFRVDYGKVSYLYQVAKQIFFLLIVAVILWFVFRSKLKDFLKAVFSAVPVALIFVMMGMYLSRFQELVYAVGTVIFGSLVFYLYKTKKSWYYYYTVIWVAAALFIMSILKVDI